MLFVIIRCQGRTRRGSQHQAEASPIAPGAERRARPAALPPPPSLPRPARQARRARPRFVERRRRKCCRTVVARVEGPSERSAAAHCSRNTAVVAHGSPPGVSRRVALVIIRLVHGNVIPVGIPWDGTGINCYRMGMGQINMSHGQP